MNYPISCLWHSRLWRMDSRFWAVWNVCTNLSHLPTLARRRTPCSQPPCSPPPAAPKCPPPSCHWYGLSLTLRLFESTGSNPFAFSISPSLCNAQQRQPRSCTPSEATHSLSRTSLSKTLRGDQSSDHETLRGYVATTVGSHCRDGGERRGFGSIGVHQGPPLPKRHVSGRCPKYNAPANPPACAFVPPCAVPFSMLRNTLSSLLPSLSRAALHTPVACLSPLPIFGRRTFLGLPARREQPATPCSPYIPLLRLPLLAFLFGQFHHRRRRHRNSDSELACTPLVILILLSDCLKRSRTLIPLLF